MRESMGPKKIALIVAAIVIIVIAGGIVASGSLTKHDDHAEQTYEYTCTGIKPTGILVDDDGNVVIRISTWKGDPNSLYTTWGLRDQYAPVPFDDVQWLQYIVKIQRTQSCRCASSKINCRKRTIFHLIRHILHFPKKCLFVKIHLFFPLDYRK